MPQFADSETVLNAISMIKGAWESVSEVKIRNCFRKAFNRNDDAEEEQQVILVPDIRMDEYTNCDSDLACYGELTVDEIIKDVVEANSDLNDQEDPTNELPPTEVTAPPTTYKQAVAALATLRSFFHENMTNIPEIDRIEERFFHMMPQNTIQTYITHFFN